MARWKQGIKIFSVRSAYAMLFMILELMIGGCASTPAIDVAQSIHAKSFSVRPGYANIYVYRDTQSQYSGDSSIVIDNKNLGIVRENNFVFFEVTPGKHHICGDDINNILSVNADAGKNYFVAATLTGSLFTKHTVFDFSDELDGKAEVLKSTLSGRPVQHGPALHC